MQGDLSWLRVPGALDRDGSPVHRDGVGEVPGLYFVGMPWLSRRKSGIIFGVAHDAEVVAHRLTAYLGAHRSRR